MESFTGEMKLLGHSGSWEKTALSQKAAVEPNSVTAIGLLLAREESQ
jgi:hypothetical protein